MIDLHTHTFMSDGTLPPSEVIRRAALAGYEAVALTDHVDAANLEAVISALIRVCQVANRHGAIYAIPGVEITYVPPPFIAETAAAARRLGAQIVVVHGETLTEPVEEGTNRAAIEAGVEILAHPGLISDEDAALAAARGVALEITTRRGHAYTNGHVAVLARRFGARIVIDNDAHTPGDILSQAFSDRIARGAGLTPAELAAARGNSRELVARIRRRTGSE